MTWRALFPAVLMAASACGPAAPAPAGPPAETTVAVSPATSPSPTATASPTARPSPTAAASPTPPTPTATAAPTVAPTPTRPLWSATTPPAGATVPGAEWIAVPNDQGKVMLAGIFRPSGAGPFLSVLVIHGTEGFRSTHDLQFAKDLAAKGFLTAAACYYTGNWQFTSFSAPPQPVTLPDGITCPNAPDPQFQGSSSGAWPNIAVLVRALRTVPGVRADRIALFGHSRGSAGVIYSSATGVGVQGLIAAAGYPQQYLGGVAAPVLMVQGTNDQIVPLQTAKDAENALRAAGKTVEAQYYEGGSHNVAYDAPYHDQVIQRASAFLTKYLGSP